MTLEPYDFNRSYNHLRKGAFIGLTALVSLAIYGSITDSDNGSKYISIGAAGVALVAGAEIYRKIKLGD